MTVSLFSFNPAEKISIPTLNDHRSDFDYLFSLSKKYRDYSGHIVFTFDHCSFIRHNAVAFLGGLITHIKRNGGHVELIIPSMQGGVHANLAQNGFLSFCGYDEPKWLGNAVSIQHFEGTDQDAIIHYLNEEWLRRSWLSISPRLLDEIVGAVWEIFTNAFEHSETRHGIFTCGQKYPSLNQLNLTLVDFGIGIPVNVRRYAKQKGRDSDCIPSDKALQWAFTKGSSTKKGKRNAGVGLDLLKEFIRLNKGTLEFYSNDGYVFIGNDKEIYESGLPGFEGTAINLMLRCDEKYYHFSDETFDDIWA